MKTPTGKYSEKDVLWNKGVPKSVRQFTAKVTDDAAFLKINYFTIIFEKV